ncbi:hypothetical protein [Nocardia donostiensis]|uniref:hypothetical protein n=1 Tax=Nocardia donostiensis TaxID=1538463 RepID=UPI003CCBFB1F
MPSHDYLTSRNERLPRPTCHYVEPAQPRLGIPEYMTWEELEQLPAEIAEQIELRDGRVVWL